MILTIMRDKNNVFTGAVITNIEVEELSVLKGAVNEFHEKLQRLGFTEDHRFIKDTKKVMNALTS